MKESSCVINDADPVCISVCGNSDIAVAVQHIILQRTKGGGIGCRKLSAKQGVIAFVDGLHLASCNGQNGLQRSLTDAVKGI